MTYSYVSESTRFALRIQTILHTCVSKAILEVSVTNHIELKNLFGYEIELCN